MSELIDKMGRRPKILSLGYALPEHLYTQREIFDLLGYPRHFWRIFRDAQIDTRRFVLPLDKIKTLSFQEQQVEYPRHAVPLARQALLQAMDGGDPKQLGLLTYATCTGFPPGPTIGHYLADEFCLPTSTQINNLSSLGCEAALPGLRLCYYFTATTGKPSAAICCELTSLTYYPEPEGKPDPEHNFEVARANAIFGDGCSCAIVGFDSDPHHPTIIDFVTHLDTSYKDMLGYSWRNGRLRVRLSREVPDVATMLVGKAVDELLARHQLSIVDIRHWVFHPPGAIVLDKIRDSLGIPEEKLRYSREVLRKVGNVSSATVGIVGKTLISQEVDPEGYLIMANVGPGMVSNAALMRFGE